MWHGFAPIELLSAGGTTLSCVLNLIAQICQLQFDNHFQYWFRTSPKRGADRTLLCFSSFVASATSAVGLYVKTIATTKLCGGLTWTSFGKIILQQHFHVASCNFVPNFGGKTHS